MYILVLTIHTYVCTYVRLVQGLTLLESMQGQGLLLASEQIE